MKSIIRMEPLFILSLLIFAGCDRFPRDNPNDRANTDGGASEGGPEIILAEQPMIDDALEYDEQNNRNGVIELGETIRFMAELMNVGDATATGVAATISFTNPCVVSSTVRSTDVGRARYGDIEPGRIGPSSETAGSFYYEVIFSSTECSDEDTVELVVRDEDNNHWDVPLEFEIVESELSVEIEEQFVSDTVPNEACNEDNTSFEIGEAVQIDIRIRNSGSSLARNVQARLLWDSADCIHFPRGEERKSEWLSYGDIESGSSKEADQSEGFFVRTRVEECVEGNLDFEMEIRDASERFLDQPLPIENIILERLDVNLVHDDEESIDDSTEYSDENNGDYNADPGEVVYLYVNFRNDGRVPAQRVQFTIDTDQRPSRCVRDWGILEPSELGQAEAQLDYNEIGSDQSVPGWILEVELSDEDCTSGENIEWIVKAETACTREITIPVTITID